MKKPGARIEGGENQVEKVVSDIESLRKSILAPFEEAERKIAEADAISAKLVNEEVVFIRRVEIVREPGGKPKLDFATRRGKSVFTLLGSGNLGNEIDTDYFLKKKIGTSNGSIEIGENGTVEIWQGDKVIKLERKTNGRPLSVVFGGESFLVDNENLIREILKQRAEKRISMERGHYPQEKKQEMEKFSEETRGYAARVGEEIIEKIRGGEKSPISVKALSIEVEEGKPLLIMSVRIGGEYYNSLQRFDVRLPLDKGEALEVARETVQEAKNTTKGINATPQDFFRVPVTTYRSKEAIDIINKSQELERIEKQLEQLRKDEEELEKKIREGPLFLTWQLTAVKSRIVSLEEVRQMILSLLEVIRKRDSTTEKD